MQQATKASLSLPRARLIESMQKLGFGTIENLVVLDGEPVFNPPPQFIRNVKFGGENGPRPEASLDDFALKERVQDLLNQFESLRNATIRRLEVRYGLPFRMDVLEVTG